MGDVDFKVISAAEIQINSKNPGFERKNQLSEELNVMISNLNPYFDITHLQNGMAFLFQHLRLTYSRYSEVIPPSL